MGGGGSETPMSKFGNVGEWGEYKHGKKDSYQIKVFSLDLFSII